MIPMTNDLAGLIGLYAQYVENRSLLFEKFSVPKFTGQGERRVEAGRWSVLRIVSRGGDLLKKDSVEYRRKSEGRNVEPHKAETLQRNAEFVSKLSAVALLDSHSSTMAAKNKTFLGELEKSFRGRTATFNCTLASRLLINLAGGVVENAGIALDRCFGLPYLPGSAVKGIARATALWEIRNSPDKGKMELLKLALRVFGYGGRDISASGDFSWAAGAALCSQAAEETGAQDYKGCLTFLPGLPLTTPRLVVDIVNPHFPKYYRGGELTNTDKPIPNYFPAVESGAIFGFCILVNRTPAGSCGANELLEAGKRWIENALTVMGAGAKTGSGYGWFQLEKATPSKESAGRVETVDVLVSSVDQFISDWKGKLRTKDNFPAALPKLNALSSQEDLRRAFEAVIPEQERYKLKKGNPYWQAFTSGRHEKDGKKILERLGIKLT